MDPRLHHPYTCLVAGPTSCGKTQFVKRLIEEGEHVVNGSAEKIIWLYGEYQPAYMELSSKFPHILFMEGIPKNLNEYIDPKFRNLIVIDDLMSETGGDKKVTNLFTKGSHHRNLSVILLLQNLFYNGKESRTISLNAHYIVLFKNPRDNTIVTSLAKQMYPGKVKFLQEAFRDAMKLPYHYLFLDLKPYTNEKFRVRTCIMPSETQYAYVNKM